MVESKPEPLSELLPAGACRTGHVLVVDDDPAMRDLLRDVLRRDGHAVSVAHHGLEAVAALQAVQFDVLILDVRMPGLGGIEVLSLLPAPRPLTVVMSGFPDSVVEAAAQHLGADAVLAKPFELGDLRVLVATLLGRRERALHA